MQAAREIFGIVAGGELGRLLSQPSHGSSTLMLLQMRARTIAVLGKFVVGVGFLIVRLSWDRVRFLSGAVLACRGWGWRVRKA